MTQYIDKDALVAEINQRIEDYKSHKIDDSYHDGLIFALEDLRDDFIDTLEVKEVDLEEKATQLSQKYFPDEENIWARPNIEAQDCKNACIEMAKWQKEKIMTKAIGGVVTFDYYGDDDKTYGCIAHDSFCLEDFGLKDRDEVKVIVIRED